MPTAMTGLPTWTLLSTKGARSYWGQLALPVTKPPPCTKATTGRGEETAAAGTETLRVRHSVSLNWNSPKGRPCWSSRCSRAQFSGSATGRGLSLVSAGCVWGLWAQGRAEKNTQSWWHRRPERWRTVRPVCPSRSGWPVSRTGGRGTGRRAGGAGAWCPAPALARGARRTGMVMPTTWCCGNVF